MGIYSIKKKVYAVGPTKSTTIRYHIKLLDRLEIVRQDKGYANLTDLVTTILDEFCQNEDKIKTKTKS